MEKNWEMIKLVNFEPLIMILKKVCSLSKKAGGGEPYMTYVYHFNPSLTNHEIKITV